MMIATIAQKLLNDRGEMFGPGVYNLDTIEQAVKLANSLPVQYIQYNWDNAAGQVTEFYSYTPEEWDTFDLLPNLQCIKVYGRSVVWSEFEDYIKNKVQPEGAVFDN